MPSASQAGFRQGVCRRGRAAGRCRPRPRMSGAGLDLEPQGLESVIMEARVEGEDLLLDGSHLAADVILGFAQQRIEHRRDDAGDGQRQGDGKAVEGAGGDPHSVAAQPQQVACAAHRVDQRRQARRVDGGTQVGDVNIDHVGLGRSDNPTPLRAACCGSPPGRRGASGIRAARMPWA